MRYLVPDFILKQEQNQRRQGHFEAGTLFIDLSGFTTITQTLMQHGKEGSEILAGIINQTFEPIIQTIYRYQGFVANFVGDGLIAVFPQEEGLPVERVIQAAWQIQELFTKGNEHQTRFGTFSLAIKQGVSAGLVEWGIVGDKPRRHYYFRGAAIDGCFHAESQAGKDEIILEDTAHALLSTQLAVVATQNNCTQLIGLKDDGSLARPSLPALPQSGIEDSSYFPSQLWSVPYQGEFRNVAVLFLSFEDITDFSELDMFAQYILLAAEQFGGYFNKLSFGDKGNVILLLFGAPVSFGNNRQRALDFVLTLQAELPATINISWRAGLTYGIAYTGFVGASYQEEYTALGNIVNLASRLMTRAEWGQVLVAGSIATQSGYSFTQLGSIAYKGYTGPVPTYQLVGKVTTDHIFLEKLIGREQELDRLVNFSHHVFIEKSIGVVLVYGEAGMGKSHLVHSLSQVLSGEMSWFIGQSNTVVQEDFSAFTYFLLSYFEQSTARSIPENRVQFDRVFDDLLLRLSHQPDADDLYNELERGRSIIGALIKLFWADSLYEQLDGLSRYENKVLMIVTFMQAICKLGSVALVLEDGHLLDTSSRTVLESLTRQSHAFPLLILITSRYADDGSYLQYPVENAASVLQIDLKDLSSGALQGLAETILQTAVSKEIQSLLQTKSQGNPFFAQQILYYLHENNMLQTIEVDGKLVTTVKGHLDELPANLNSLLVARLDRLSYQVKTVVQTAAVLGQEFEVRLLTQMLDQDITPSIQTATELQIWQLLNDLEYMFKHVLLRDTAYEMQLKGRLRQLHYLAATTAEKLYANQLSSYLTTLAYHYESAYLLGEEAVCEKAYHYLYQAGQQAVDHYENQTAVTYFSRALAIVPETDQTAQYKLLLAREAACNNLGERTQQAKDLTRLQTLAVEMGGIAQLQVLLRQANYANMTGDLEEAIAQVKTTINLATDHRLLAAQAHQQWGVILHKQGNFIPAQEQFETAVALLREGLNEQQSITDLYFDRPNPEKLLADCLRGLGVLSWRATQFDDAWAHYESALTIYRQLPDLKGEGACLTNLGIVAKDRGDVAQGRELYEQALAIWNQIGFQFGRSNLLNNLGLLTRTASDFDQAIVYHKQALVIQQAIGDSYGEAWSIHNLALVDFDMGNYEAALNGYKEALERQQKLGDRFGVGITSGNLGMLTQKMGNYRQSYTYHEQSLIIKKEIGDRSGEAGTLIELGNLMMSLGNYEQAGQYFDEALPILQEAKYSSREALVLVSKAWLLYQHDQKRLALKPAKESIAILESIDRPAQLTRTFILLGILQVGIGQISEGLATLEKAADAVQKLQVDDVTTMWQFEFAAVLLLNGEEQRALALIEPNLPRLQDGSLPPYNLAMGLGRMYLIAYQVLQANNDSRAAALLETAHTQLQAISETLTFAEQEMFWHHVPEHQQLQLLWTRNIS